ncbi:hypothetical protein MQY53_003064 [Salmonella enterica subsp. enterica]|nr:hypothetical protein [Salmonella enterica subsp. enterica]
MDKKNKSKKYRRAWTPEEIEFVKVNYGFMMTSVIAEKLGRTENAVRWIIRGLDIPLTEKYRPWTAVEKKIIRTYSSRPDGIELVASMLPWRTRGAIFRMMDKLGIARPRKWKEQECQILEQYYSVEGVAVAERLPGRTPHAVRSMANQLGIKPVTGVIQQKWTPEEWQRLVENKHLPLVELAALFPDRTQVSVRKALSRMKNGQGTMKESVPQKNHCEEAHRNLSQATCPELPENYNNQCLAWTAHDLAFVKAHYGVMKTTELAEKLGRSVTSIRRVGGKFVRGKNSGLKTSEKHRNHRQAWTTRELRFVETHYGTMKTADIAKTLGRTVVSVRLEAQNLGCCKTSCIPWTEEEEAVIRREYACGTRTDKIAKLLPGRTRNAIALRAAKLKVNNARIWSEQEDKLLKQHYPAMGTRVAEMLPGRTALAVRSRASNLGIDFQGDEKSYWRMWSEKEWQLLENNSHLALSELTALFPGRSSVSVRQALKRLKSRQIVEGE